jgi:hypothetical protein
MTKMNVRLLWGGLLILAGVMFLLQRLNLIPDAWDLIWAVVFGFAGLVFLYAFWIDRSQWWPIIPGIALLSLGVVIGFEELFPGSDWIGSIFLGALGLTFCIIYAVNREQWWAVIPGGILLTLAVVAGLDKFLIGELEGGIVMMGMGVTFAVVGLLPTQHGPMRWAFIPGGVLFIIGIFLLTPQLPVMNYIWPLAIILVGIYFILRNFRS